jgi:hypothetical protein
MAGLTMAITIHNASFAPWASDAGTYVHAARRWAQRDLFSPDEFQMWPRWKHLGVPAGHTTTAISGTYATIVPLGFPVLLAVGDMVDSQVGVYTVAPFFAGLLALLTFDVGRRVTSAAAAFTAAAAVGPALLAWSQHLLYGAALKSGYTPLSSFWAWPQSHSTSRASDGRARNSD